MCLHSWNGDFVFLKSKKTASACCRWLWFTKFGEAWKNIKGLHSICSRVTKTMVTNVWHQQYKVKPSQRCEAIVQKRRMVEKQTTVFQIKTWGTYQKNLSCCLQIYKSVSFHCRLVTNTGSSVKDTLLFVVTKSIKTQPLKLVKGIVLIVIGTLQFRGSASLISCFSNPQTSTYSNLIIHRY